MNTEQCVALVVANEICDELFSISPCPKSLLPFGGKFKLIDFALSCCANARLGAVGVIDDYPSKKIADYIGSGRPWDLDRQNGGVKMIYSDDKNSVFDFLQKYDSENVLVLRGDCIHKLDIAEMLFRHKESRADCTIAVKSDFIDERLVVEGDLIVSIEDMPVKNVSLGIGAYIFNKSALVRELNSESIENLWGIISSLLDKGGTILTFGYNGYFSDANSIFSVFKANMDLLDTGELRNLLPYTCSETLPPCYISGEVTDSLVSEGSEIYGNVINSVIGKNVTIAKGAVVKNSVVMDGVIVGENSVLDHSVIGEDVTIGDGSVIGEGNGHGEIAIIANGVEIGDGERIVAGSIIGHED